MLRDQNLFYHVKRGGLFPTLKEGEYISDEYKRTGKFNNEASIQGYGNTGGGSDANIFFRRKRKRKQPILRKRVFKDLDPKSRIIGRLDLTKKERQATAQIESIQGLEDMVRNFMRTPRLHPNGSPVINARTGDPEFEMRTLDEIIKVNQGAIFEALKKNNIVPNQRISNIVFTFNSINVQNVLNKYQAILAGFPGASQQEKDNLFTAAIVNERLKDPDEMPPGIEVDLGEELERKDMGIPGSWKEPELVNLYPTRGFQPSQWKDNIPAQLALEAYIEKRQFSTPNRLETVTGIKIAMRLLGAQFRWGHVLDLDTLKFLRNEVGNAAIIDEQHPSF